MWNWLGEVRIQKLLSPVFNIILKVDITYIIRKILIQENRFLTILNSVFGQLLNQFDLFFRQSAGKFHINQHILISAGSPF